MPAVHSQVAPRHKGAGIADQKHSGTTVLLGRAEPAEHVLCGPLLATLGKLDEELLDHGGDDVAWRDGVDADAELAPFGGEIAGKLEDTGFGGVVCGTDEALDNIICVSFFRPEVDMLTT